MKQFGIVNTEDDISQWKAEAKELDELRQRRASLVMSLIGPLLDTWNHLPNRLKDDSELAALKAKLMEIDAHMEKPNG